MIFISVIGFSSVWSIIITIADKHGKVCLGELWVKLTAPDKWPSSWTDDCCRLFSGACPAPRCAAATQHLCGSGIPLLSLNYIISLAFSFFFFLNLSAKWIWFTIPMSFQAFWKWCITRNCPADLSNHLSSWYTRNQLQSSDLKDNLVDFD